MARTIIVGTLRTWCPATSTSSVHDPLVRKIQLVARTLRTGVRACPTCGAQNVPVQQALRFGQPSQPWVYTPHFQPVQTPPSS